jgi:hypothetical protein
MRLRMSRYLVSDYFLDATSQFLSSRMLFAVAVSVGSQRTAADPRGETEDDSKAVF